MAGRSLNRFEAIRGQTECVFAQGSKLWGFDEWRDEAFERNLDRFADRLEEFVGVAEEQALDGIVLEITEPGAGQSVEQLARTTRAVIDGLIARDGHADPSVPVDDPRWWMTFAGEPLFVAAFAPCYDASSSRYGFGLEHTYLLFQTRGSFVRRRPDGADGLAESARRRIRAAFSDAGRPYDLAITLSELEAHRYVKPGRLGEGPIEWWKAGETGR